MGDRANVLIKGYDDEPGKGVYLYTHWQGHELPETVRDALRRKQRWTDRQYLARIIFCAMVEGNERSETGFGISTTLCDNEHPIIVIDCTQQTIGFAREGEEPETYKSWPMSRFIEMSGSDIRAGM